MSDQPLPLYVYYGDDLYARATYEDIMAQPCVVAAIEAARREGPPQPIEDVQQPRTCPGCGARLPDSIYGLENHVAGCPEIPF